jgi:hypothetical protein
MKILDELDDLAARLDAHGNAVLISRRTLKRLVHVARQANHLNRVYTIDDRRDAYIEMSLALTELEKCIP